jgi:alpha-galactosidase
MRALLFLPIAAAYDNAAPFSRLPVLGWSSWVALGPGAEHPIFDFCDEFSVMQSIDAFVSVGFYEAGYRHFHLDDCWAGGRYANGSVYPEADHFPNGMKKVVDYAHSKGLAFGLYTCGGTKTCVGGRPGSKDHWAADADTYASWGVDWVKMDWCNSAPQDPKTTYPTMSAAMNKTGRAMHFNSKPVSSASSSVSSSVATRRLPRLPPRPPPPRSLRARSLHAAFLRRSVRVG